MKFAILLIFFLPFSLSCSDDSDCSFLNSCISGSCVHKDLFYSFTWLEIFCLFLFFLSTVFATLGGVGGGILFYPYLMMILGFSSEDAAPISITLVFFCLFFRHTLSLPDRANYRDRQAINIDIILVFAPSVTIGTVFGVVINEVASIWFLLGLLILLMGLNAYLTLKKAIELRTKTLSEKKIDLNLTKDIQIYFEALKTKILELERPYLNETEQDIVQKTPLLENVKPLEEVPLEDIKTEYSYSKQLPLDKPGIKWNLPQMKRIASELEIMLKKEEEIVDFGKLTLIFLNVFVEVFFMMLRGTDLVDSLIGIESCSTEFWFLVFAYIPFGLIFMVIVVKYLTREDARRLENGYVFHKNDLHYDLRMCLVILIVGISVGLVSSILGVGGAIVLGPLLLNFGIETQEASFTASFTAFFSSLSSVIQYFIAGNIKWDYALTYGVFCVIGMIIGLRGLFSYFKKKNMLYVIPFTLVGLTIATTILNFTSYVMEIIDDPDSWSFQAFC